MFSECKEPALKRNCSTQIDCRNGLCIYFTIHTMYDLCCFAGTGTICGHRGFVKG